MTIKINIFLVNAFASREYTRYIHYLKYVLITRSMKVSRSIFLICISAAIIIMKIYRHCNLVGTKIVNLTIAMRSAMSIRMILSPLLIANYVFGLRIMEFPAGHSRLWFSLVYILLIWSVFCVSQFNTMDLYMNHYSFAQHTTHWVDVFTTLLSIVFGMYHDEKLRNCLKKIASVDATLEKLGMTTNYQQLYKRVIWVISVWSIIAMSLNWAHFIYLGYSFDYDTVKKFYISFTINHCSHLNLLGDLTITSVLGYIGIKFDQIKEHLQSLAGGNKYGTKQAWENPILHLSQRNRGLIPRTADSKWIIWTLMHLHLELRKISREIDMIFGMQMTFKMGCYFGLMTMDLHEIFNTFFDCYITNQRDLLYISIYIVWLLHNILKLLIINYIYEKISSKANATGNFADGILLCTNDFEVYENVSQLLLQMTLSPLRFYGLGLFQFGFKFFRKFITSSSTVLVILIQSHINK